MAKEIFNNFGADSPLYFQAKAGCRRDKPPLSQLVPAQRHQRRFCADQAD
jgi:hypothetical protein